MNNELSSLYKIKGIVYVCSAVSIIIIEYLRNKILPFIYKKKIMRGVKNYSPAEFKIFCNAKNIQNGEPIIISGKFKKQQYVPFQKFGVNELNFNLHNYISKNKILKIPIEYTGNVYRYNFRQGSVNKVDSMINFISQYIYLLSRKSYLLYDDMISIFGYVKRNHDTNKYYLEPIIISQGNKNFMENKMNKINKIFSKVENSIMYSLFFLLASDSFGIILSYFNYYTGHNYFPDMVKKAEKFASNYRENCKKCNLYYKNVVFLDCNHFVYCLRCFHSCNKICPLCPNDLNGKKNIKILIDK
jgi:hypothetical protein